MGQHSKVTAKNFVAEAERRGYAVAQAEDGLAITEVVEEFRKAGSKVLRDSKVSSAPGDGDLVAEPGDFWFHTDGSFVPVPPRWVFVTILHAEGGGEVGLLDTRPLWPEVPRGTVWFGKPGKDMPAYPILAGSPGREYFRYRRDLMFPAAMDPSKFHAFHNRIREAATSALDLGALPNGASYLLNNAWMIHRRRPFSGVRTIAQLWLSAPG